MNRFALIVVIGAAVAGCGGRGTEVARTPPPDCVPQRDNLIVPGCRIGPIAIGMTNEDLLRTLGPPRLSRDQGKFVSNQYDSLKITAMVEGGRVGWLFTTDPRYHTAAGVRVGSSIMEATVSLGEPAWKRTNPHSGDAGYVNNCFSAGVTMSTGAAWASDAGRIRDIWVVKGCR